MGKCADWGYRSPIWIFCKCFYNIIDMRYNVCKKIHLHCTDKITKFYVLYFLNGKEKIIQSTADINDCVLLCSSSSIFKNYSCWTYSFMYFFFNCKISTAKYQKNIFRILKWHNQRLLCLTPVVRIFWI